MGGLLCLMAVTKDPKIADGLILEAAALKLHPSTAAWWQGLGAKVLNGLAPGIKVGKLDKKLITRNAAVIQSIENDENCADTGGTTAGFAVRMMKDTGLPPLCNIAYVFLKKKYFSAQN